VLDIVTETRVFIEAALAGDPALSSLVLTGGGTDLAAAIDPGRPPTKVGRTEYMPQAPFTREQLVELVVRMQRSRWGRFDAYALALWPAGDDDMKRLGDYDAMRFDTFTRGCECGPGWYDLLDATLGWIAEAQPNAWWKASQIKEKFGTLRLYYDGNPGDEGGAIIDAAEHLSGFVCDVCGAPGKTGGRGWISTRCELHNGDWR